jgi:hypothetical protein
MARCGSAHLVRDQIRNDAVCGSCLEARPPASPGSTLPPVPHAFPIRIQLLRRLQTSVRPKHRAVVGSDRKRANSCCVLTRCDILALERVVRWNLRRRAGVIGIECKAA